MAALTRAAAGVLLLAGLLGAAPPVERNLYGWPVRAPATLLTGEPERIPAFRPGTDVRKLSGTTLLGVPSLLDGELILDAGRDRALVSTYEALSLVDLRSDQATWTRQTDDRFTGVFGADGSWALLASEGELGIRELSAGRVKASWPRDPDDDYIYYDVLALSPDDRTAALARGDAGLVELRWTSDGEVLRTFGSPGSIEQLRFSRDGELLLAFGAYGLRLWEVDSGRARFVEDDPRWRGGAPSADLSELFVVGDDGLVERIELKRGGQRQAWTVPGRPDLWEVVPLGGGRVAVMGDATGPLVLDLDKGRLVARLEGRGRLSLSPDGRWLQLTEGPAWSAWSLPDLEPKAKGARHQGPVQALALTDTLVASGDEAGTVLVRRVSDGQLVAHLFGRSGGVTGLALPPSGSPAAGAVLVGDDQGQVWLLDLETGAPRAQATLTRNDDGWPEVAVAFSADGQRVIAGLRRDDCSSCGAVSVLDATTLEPLGSIPSVAVDRILAQGELAVGSGYESPIVALSLDPPAQLRGEGHRYESFGWAALREDGALVIAWEEDDGDLLYSLGQASPLELETCGVVTLGEAGRRLVLDDCDGGLQVIDTRDGRPLQTLRPAVTREGVWMERATLAGDTLAIGWSTGVVSLQPLRPLGPMSPGAPVAGAAPGVVGTLSLQSFPPPRHPSPSPEATELSPPLADLGECELPIGLAGGLSVCADGRVHLFREGDEIEVSDYLGYGALGARAGQLAFASGDTLRLLTVEGGRLRFAGTSALPFSGALHVSLGGDRVLVVGRSYSVLVRASSGEVLHVLEGQPGGADQGAVSPDGVLVATGGPESAVVWRDGAPWVLLETDASDGLAFSEDGRQLITRSRRGEALAWELPK